MFDALLQRVAQCCAALVAAQQDAGPTLRQALFAGAKAVTESCVELVSSPYPLVPFPFDRCTAPVSPFRSVLSLPSPNSCCMSAAHCSITVHFACQRAHISDLLGTPCPACKVCTRPVSELRSMGWGWRPASPSAAEHLCYPPGEAHRILADLGPYLSSRLLLSLLYSGCRSRHRHQRAAAPGLRTLLMCHTARCRSAKCHWGQRTRAAFK